MAWTGSSGSGGTLFKWNVKYAGLDWSIVQEPIFTSLGEEVNGFRANVRDTDRKVLGVVTDRYKVVQNVEVFRFTDEMLGFGVRYETAGSLSEDRKILILAWLPREYIQEQWIALDVQNQKLHKEL